MSVEFNEENNFNQSNMAAFGAKKMPAMAKFLINKGVVKDEAGANKVLIGVAVLFFAVSIYLFIF